MIQDLTVGIVFRNEQSKITKCLTSLKYIKAHVPHLHVILVDNHSTDQSAKIAVECLSKFHDSYELISRSENHMAQARNDVLNRTRTAYLYFTDADCELTEKTWPELMKQFSSGTNYCAWGGGQVFSLDSEFHKSMETMRNSFLGHFGSAQMMKGSRACDVDHLSTMSVLYDVEKLRSVNGFNNLLSKSAEDLELSLRLRAAGFQLRFVPSAMILHYQFQTASDWAVKAFRNGIWQTRLMAYNMDILKTFRPWPGLIALVLWPVLASLVPLYILSLVLLVTLEKGLNFNERVQLFAAFLITHLAYGLGEIYGVFLAIIDEIKLYKAPSSTKS